MKQNQIAVFASKLSAFRDTLEADERILLDRIVTLKDGDDDVSAHQLIRRFQFALEGDAYRIIAMKAGDGDEVLAHRLTF